MADAGVDVAVVMRNLQSGSMLLEEVHKAEQQHMAEIQVARLLQATFSTEGEASNPADDSKRESLGIVYQKYILEFRAEWLRFSFGSLGICEVGSRVRISDTPPKTLLVRFICPDGNFAEWKIARFGELPAQFRRPLASAIDGALQVVPEGSGDDFRRISQILCKPELLVEEAEQERSAALTALKDARLQVREREELIRTLRLRLAEIDQSVLQARRNRDTIAANALLEEAEQIRHRVPIIGREIDFFSFQSGNILAQHGDLEQPSK
jgi:hypothetical protein